MAHLIPELKIRILSYLDTPAALSRLGQSCQTWYEVANEELYKRDARENNSYAIKWMAAHAVNDQTTNSALRTLKISVGWGGQIEAVQTHVPVVQRNISVEQEDRLMYASTSALNIAVVLGNIRLTMELLKIGARHDIPCTTVDWLLAQPRTVGRIVQPRMVERIEYFRGIFQPYFVFGQAFPLYLAFMKGNVHMCQLLLERGVERYAMVVEYDFGATFMLVSILHVVAADPTTNGNQWRFFFDRFREQINEPCSNMRLTPLHVAMLSGCDQGVRNALEAGANEEARNSAMQTPGMMSSEPAV